MSKCARKLVMLCRKAKNAEKRGVARNFFATNWEIFVPPTEYYSATPWKKS